MCLSSYPSCLSNRLPQQIVVLSHYKKYTKEAYTMTDKTKRIILIAVCCLLCIAAAVGIAVRFGGNANISSGVVSDDPTQSGNPSVDINNNSQTDLDVQMETPDASETDPAQGADSSGLEQTIQADPVKPESPEKPEAPSGTTTLPDDHDGTDVPEEERKTVLRPRRSGRSWATSMWAERSCWWRTTP